MEDMNEIWTEKYRPKKISEISGQKNIKTKLQAFADEKSIPHYRGALKESDVRKHRSVK